MRDGRLLFNKCAKTEAKRSSVGDVVVEDSCTGQVIGIDDLWGAFQLWHSMTTETEWVNL